jgi:beta-galactosidase
MGVRVDEWDARGPDTVNPVRFAADPARLAGGLDVGARLLFELLIPQGAEVIGHYRSDFYAGTPAVTRNSFGAGHGWYVGTALDQPGVTWIVRTILDRHGLLGPYPDLPLLETTTRITPAGDRLVFLLNHADAAAGPTAVHTGVDLLTGARVAAGHPLTVPAREVMVIREDDR